VELGGDRTFRYRAPSITDVAMPLLCLGGLAVTGAALLRFALVYGALPSGRWQLWFLVAQFGVLLLACVWMDAYLRLWRARGYVEVTRVGVATHDWRGREERMFWDEVGELKSGRVPSFGRRTAIPNAAFELRGGGKVLRIGRRIEDRDELHDLIIERTGLVPAEKTWYGMVIYRRP
jgi:hypothetical protein